MKQAMITIRLTPKEKKALKLQALKADITLTEFILNAIRSQVNVTDPAIPLAKNIPQTEENIASGL